MKILTIACSFTLLFSVASLSQSTIEPCEPIVVEANEMVRPEESILAIAKFGTSPIQSTDTFDWIVVRRFPNSKQVSTTRYFDTAKLSIPTSWKDNHSTFSITAIPSSSDCNQLSLVDVWVTNGVFDPEYIDEFDLTNWAETRFRLDNALIRLEGNTDIRLFIFLEFPDQNSTINSRYTIDRVFNFLTRTRKAPPERIIFALRDGHRKGKVFVRFQSVPKSVDISSWLDKHLVITGDDYLKKRRFLR